MEKLKEGVYWTGKRVIYPLKKDMEKPISIANLDWKNLLGIRNFSMFLMVLLLVFSLLGVSYAYKYDMQQCFEVIENPQKYCSNFMILPSEDSEYNYLTNLSELKELVIPIANNTYSP